MRQTITCLKDRVNAKELLTPGYKAEVMSALITGSETETTFSIYKDVRDKLRKKWLPLREDRILELKKQGNARILRPGDFISKAIHTKYGKHIKIGCGCNEMRLLMNAWGWLGCWIRRDQIITHMKQQARKEGLPDNVGDFIKDILRGKQNG